MRCALLTFALFGCRYHPEHAEEYLGARYRLPAVCISGDSSPEQICYERGGPRVWRCVDGGQGCGSYKTACEPLAVPPAEMSEP